MKARTTIVGDDDRDGEGSDGPRLLVIGKDSYETYRLPTAGSVIVGRADNCDVRIDDPLASRQHARLTIGEGFAVEDLGSVNGTRVLDRPVARGEAVSFQPGETIAIGSCVLIVHVRSRRRDDAAAGDVPTFTDGRFSESQTGWSDHAMQTINRLAERAAAGTINVLILGETGVGKEVMARAIHRLSPRRAGNCVCLNCAALSETLLESELFGHERGAFTGATQTKMGLIESAEGGTLFLDEVGELPPTIQAKLLRVLETREVTRVGSVRPKRVDVRFVAATNRDLEAEVEKGTFRRDLYFRLCGISIRIPPLRERRAEIRPLAETFLREICAELGRSEVHLPPEVVTALERKRWPGNIRELKNVIERAVLLCPGDTLSVDQIPEDRRPLGHRSPAVVPVAGVAAIADERTDRVGGRGGGFGRDARDESGARGEHGADLVGRVPIRAFPSAGGGAPRNGNASSGRAGTAPAGLTAEQEADRERIVAALDACAWNQSRAAKMLNMPRRTFVARLDRYGIARPKKSPGGYPMRDD